jgi:hypothetical protein
MAAVGLTLTRQRAPAREILAPQPGSARSTSARRLVSSVLLADAIGVSIGRPVIQARCSATARSWPYSLTRNGLPNKVLRSTFTELPGMRQPLLRRSCTRCGLAFAPGFAIF